jgi:steroid delta-isomerase-like uncharacterized protein
MSEENKAAARRFYEEFMPQGVIDTADELFSEDFVNHAAPPESPAGREGARHQVKMLAEAFDEQSYDVHHVLADGDTVAVHCTWNATHTGDFMGIPPTKKRIAQKQIHVLRFDGGLIAEHWAVRDDLTMLRQMGIAPG